MATIDPQNRGNGINRPRPVKRIRDERWTVWLVPMIVLVNVEMFIITMYINNCPKNMLHKYYGHCFPKFLGRMSFQPLKYNFLFGPGVPTLENLGGLGATDDHQTWRIITSLWLHAGVVHLFVNVFSLLTIGRHLERRFGFIRVGVIYIISGISGNMLTVLFSRHDIFVGASGAAIGLMGAQLSEMLINWTTYARKAGHLFFFLSLVIIHFAFGIMPNVDDFSLVGGFVSGFLLGFVLLLRPQFGWAERRYLPAGARAKSKYLTYQYAIWVVAFMVLINGFTGGLVAVFKGVRGDEHCKWCSYVNCVFVPVPERNWHWQWACRY